MKHLALLLVFVLAGLLAAAQQTKVTFLAESITGTVIFEETQTVTTNAFGQMELQIGSVETAVFDSIDWSAGKIFIRLEVDITGGTAFKEIATVPLLAVPFAKYAENAKYAEEAAGWKKNETGISFMDGNVGIGKDNPELKFEIVAPAQSQVDEQIFKISVDDAPDDYFRIGNATGNNFRFTPYLQGVRTSDSITALYMSGFTSSAKDVGNFPLIKFDARRLDGSIQNRPLFSWNNCGNPLMTMTADGNLGIGTTSPSAKLTVDGQIRILDSWRGIQMITDDQRYDLIVGGSSQDKRFAIYDATIGSYRLYINGSGYVGIGTTSPARTLHVSDVMRLQPRSSAPSGAAMGDMYFDSSTKKLMVFDGTTWKSCW